MTPKIYDKQRHNIREPLVDRDALFVLTRLQEAGYTAYLVGGGVRDLLLERQPKDFDISTSARPEEVKALFRSCLLIGRRFRLAHVRFGRKIIEVSTFRAGDTDEATLIVRDNVWGTPEEDVLRRDFTINGLFYDPSDHSVIDYVDGFEDVGKHLLRTIGEPAARFHQDPVRMIRALKFRARFDFKLHPDILAVLPRCRGEILKSSPARLTEEFLRMLESGASEPFLRLLEEHRFLELLLPELCEEAEGEGIERVLAHLHALDEWIRSLDRYQPQRPVLMAAILYPLLEARLERLYFSLGATPNLSQVHEVTSNLVFETLYGSVLKFPRRIRAVATFILEAQYRLTPVGPRKTRRRRFVHHPDFRPSMELLHLRAALNPDLTEAHREWQQLAQEEGAPQVRAKPRRRRRRRRG